MAVYLVSRISKQPCGDRIHRHIEGVCTYPDGTHATRAAVVRSINAENEWYTHVNGVRQARIRPIRQCPRCAAVPYITTRADDELDDTLDDLLPC
jgi:hypothetical protein